MTMKEVGMPTVTPSFSKNPAYLGGPHPLPEVTITVTAQLVDGSIEYTLNPPSPVVVSEPSVLIYTLDDKTGKHVKFSGFKIDSDSESQICNMNLNRIDEKIFVVDKCDVTSKISWWFFASHDDGESQIVDPEIENEPR
jgi:hypothetical protein